MADLVCSNHTTAEAATSPTPSSRRLALSTIIAEWVMLAWALWWSWAYVRSALAQRFPEWLGWTTRLW